MCLKTGVPLIQESRINYIGRTSGVLPQSSLYKVQKNSEKRKEKSRDAARHRRTKESEIFNELSQLLPMRPCVGAALDKASVIRVAIAFLRTRNLAMFSLPMSQKRNEKTVAIKQEDCFGKPFEEALDGFLLVLTSDGYIVYTTENISTLLGMSQVDVIGQSVLDYTHPCDHDEMRQIISSSKNKKDSHLFVRFKCTLTPKGRSLNLRSATYKVVQMTGHCLKKKRNEDVSEDPSWVVAYGKPVPHPYNIEVPLDKQTFVSRHSLDMGFTYVDENVIDFCGYDSCDLLGKKIYELIHALDTKIVQSAHKTLRQKGQVETEKYRLLAHRGGYIWVVTQATLIANKDSKPQHIVCLNYVLSKVENCDVLYSSHQLEAPIEAAKKVEHLAPVAATCSLLTNRTDDMNEGYLTITANETTVFKKEPEDLTHLAPSVGGDCIPLEQFDTNFVDILYPSIWDTTSSSSFNSQFDQNHQSPPQWSPSTERMQYPFSSRQNVPDTNSSSSSSSSSPSSVPSLLNCSPQSQHRFNTPDPPLSPFLNQVANSSETNVINSNLSAPVASTSSLFTVLEDASQMDLFSSLDFKLEDEDLELRAPYIPLVDEELVLTPEDLVSEQYSQNSNDMCSRKEGRSSCYSNLRLPLDRDTSPHLSPSQIDRDTSPHLSPYSNLRLPLDRDTSPHLSPSQKLTPESGGSFVDPNQVLPGQYFKGEETVRKDFEELRYLLETPNHLLKDPGVPPWNAQKRHISNSSCAPSSKRVRGSRNFSPETNLDPPSPPPRMNAPIMQQLLVSKDPIVISSGRKRNATISSTSTKQSPNCNEASCSSPGAPHSVLRNLLVNGRDESEGYSVFPPSPDTSCNSSGPHSPESKEPVESMLTEFGSLNSIPVNKYGKVELTLEQFSNLVGKANSVQNTKNVPCPPQPQKKTSISSSLDQLLDISSYDLSTSSLLQGDDLILALDQSSKG